jgi:amidohydrolase
MPHLGIDPIYAAARIVVALKAAPGMIDPLKSAVISVCQFNAGTEWNRIPETASLAGTTRCFDNELRKDIQDMVEEVAKKTAEETGASAIVRWKHGSAVVINDEKCNRVAEKALEKVSGDGVPFHYSGTMGGDDFAEYLNMKPGIFAMIGINDIEKCKQYPHHNPRFDIDEDMLAVGAELAAQYALDWLEEEL